MPVISYAIAVTTADDHYLIDHNDLREFNGEFAIEFDALVIRWVEKNPDRAINMQGLADAFVPGADPALSTPAVESPGDAATQAAEPELPLDPPKTPAEHEDGLDV